MASSVSLVKSKDSYDGVLAALKPLEKSVKKALKGKKRPLIKVNFVSTHEPLAATPVEAVQATLDFLQPLYSGKIMIVEGATLGSTPEGWRNFDYLPLKRKYKVKLVDLNHDRTRPVKLLDRQGRPFSIPLCQTVEKSDFVISICRPKTHDTVVVTLTLKNLLVGSILRRGLIHQGKMIHQNLLRLAKIIKPDLAILDGTFGMEGNGPVSGEAITAGWALASLDWLTADSLAAWLMGFNLKDIGYLFLAHQKKLGQAYPGRNVKVIGEKPAKLRKKFRPHKTYSSQINWR